MIPSLWNPMITCRTCGQKILADATVKIIQMGTVVRIGGLGQFKDDLIFKGTGYTVEHEGTCPEKR